MKLRIRWFFVLVLVSWVAGQVFAQMGIIRGKVQDEQGNPLKDVLIKIEGPARNYKLKTNKKGEFFRVGIPFREVFRVTAEKVGYVTTYLDNMKPGRPTEFGSTETQGVVNFTLKKAEGATGPGGVKLEDRTVVAAVNKGLNLLGQGQYQQAVDAFRQALEKAPDYYYIWSNLGNAYVKMEQFDQAIEAFEKAIALDPKNGSLYTSLGNAYAGKRDTKKASQAFEKAASLAGSPADIAVSYYNMGITFVNLGQNQQAVDAFQKAIDTDPQNGEAHYQLGIVLLGMNRIREAVDHLKKYGEVTPDGPNAPTAQSLVEELSSK